MPTLPTIPGITIVRELPKGDLCDVYEGAVGSQRFVVKIASNKADNDLVATDGRMSRRLYPATASDEKFYRYLCKCHSSGVVDGKAYNVFALAVDKVGTPPEYVSLADVMTAYPNGIDYRDMAWMFKRTLVILGWTHQKNVIHGNVTPPHILVHPIGHGGKLIDWSYAVLLKDDPKAPAKPVTKPSRPTAWARLMDDEDEAHVILEEEPPGPPHIKAITPRYGAFYPPEVMAKKTPTPATDIYMLAKCVVSLLGGNPATNYVPNEVPRKIREMLADMLIEDVARRSADAWAIHERFDAILEEQLGKPEYRPFHMSPVTPARV